MAKTKLFPAGSSKEISSSVFFISMDVAYCIYDFILCFMPSTSLCVHGDLQLNEFIFFDPCFLVNETF